MPKPYRRPLRIIDKNLVIKCVEAYSRLRSMAGAARELGISEYAVERALKIDRGDKLPRDRMEEQHRLAHEARLKRQRDLYQVNKESGESGQAKKPKPDTDTVQGMKEEHSADWYANEYLAGRRFTRNGVTYLDGKIDNCIHRRMRAVNAELKGRGLEQLGRCREWLV